VNIFIFYNKVIVDFPSQTYYEKVYENGFIN